LSRSAEENVKDTDAFTSALGICSPAVFAFYPTPRGVKRFQNRMRYFAMRINQGEEQQDWLARLIDKWLKRGVENKKENSSDDKIVITEPQLWALGLVSALNPKLLKFDVDGMLRELPNETRVIEKAVLSDTLIQLSEKFENIWPDENARRFFRELSQGIRD